MSDDEQMLDAHPYQVYVFDCPYCGCQTMLGDADPSPVEECADCGAEVEMSV